MKTQRVSRTSHWLALSACLCLALGLILTLATCGGGGDSAANDPIPIQHTIFIIKENRTFDNYFGQFPGADGKLPAVSWLLAPDDLGEHPPDSVCLGEN